VTFTVPRNVYRSAGGFDLKLAAVSVLAAAVVAMAARVGDPALDAYTAKLRAAKSLTVEFNLAAGGPPSKSTLAYSSPNRLRIETATQLSVSDGTTLWVLNKADNTYTQAPAGTGPAMADEVYAWRGFFVVTPFSDATDVTPVGKRTVGGVEVNGYKLSLPNGKTATIFISPSDGLAHSSQVLNNGNSATAIATKVELGDASLPDSTFTFTPPDGAKKIEPPVAGAGSFTAAEAVFKQYCLGCHGTDTKKAGLSLSSYAGVMAGARGQAVVVAGDPANSKVIQVLTGGTPKMPPGDDTVSADGIKAISDWIQAGAKGP
jgi:outer membrane lipoprotein-sorting protein/cytochrome c551/c552